jgi:hypothetical protein
MPEKEYNMLESVENKKRFSELENDSFVMENESLIVEKLRSCVEESRVAEARKLVSGISPGISVRIDNWRRVLAEPKVTVGNPGTDEGLREDSIWLENNALKYQGKWVALKKGTLIGSHESRIELHRSLEQSDKLAGVMFVRL